MYNITLSKEQLEELQWVFYREQSKTVKKVREDERLLHGWTLARKANIKALGE